MSCATSRLAPTPPSRGLELGAHPAEQLEIPFEDNALPGWLVRADAGETRPLLICTNGYDSLVGKCGSLTGLPRSAAAITCFSSTDPDRGRL